MLENIRVVLVNTSHPGNIGGAARAMKNMGLSQLVLVDPQDFPSADAVARASGAEDMLDAAQVVGTLEEALVGCSLVLGTSARDRRIPWPLLDPRECGVAACEQARQGAQVALVFGREYAGLTNEELQRCHFHVHIPSDPEFQFAESGGCGAGLGLRGAYGLVGGRESADQDAQIRSNCHAEFAAGNGR